MTHEQPGQATLFDVGRPAADEPRDARQRRLNRERQMRWRRRHQFMVPVPVYDDLSTTVTTCSG